MQTESMPREALFCAVLNVPPVSPGTRLSRPAHLALPLWAMLAFANQHRALFLLIARSDKRFP